MCEDPAHQARWGGHGIHINRLEPTPLRQSGAQREVRRDPAERAGDEIDDRRRGQHQDAAPAHRAHRGRCLGLGLRHRAGRSRPRRRVRQHHRHHPWWVLAGELRRVRPRDPDRRPTAASRAARRPLRIARRVLPGRDLGDVRRADRRHRRRSDPLDRVRLRRVAVPVRHPDHQADPEARLRVGRRDGRARTALLLRVHPVDLRLGLALQRELPHDRHRGHAHRDRCWPR